MTITYRFRNGSLWFKISGKVSRQDISTGISQAIADERFVVGWYLVLDLQESETNLSPDDVQILVSFMRDIREKFSSPIVSLVSNNFHFGLMRMVQIYAELRGIEMKIFRNQKEAIEEFPMLFSESQNLTLQF
jgi:hypothetical protein